MYQEHEDHGKQRRAIAALAQLDEGLAAICLEVGLIDTNLHLGENRWPRLFPLGTREIPNVGMVLVVGTRPNKDSGSINMAQNFACALLLRDATAEEAMKDGCLMSAHPEILERLRFVSVTGGFFARTGIVSECYVPA